MAAPARRAERGNPAGRAVTAAPGAARLRAAAMAEPALQAALAAEHRTDAFAELALSEAAKRGIALSASDLEVRPDPLGVYQHLPRPADGARWPPPGWMPVGVVDSGGEWMVDWVCTDGVPIDAPFFYDTVVQARGRPFNRLCGYRMRLADLAQSAPETVAPAGFVYHLSRCGSTLVHRMLAASGTAASLSEPAAFDAVVRLCLGWDGPDAAKHRLLRAAAAGLGNGAGGKPLALKLDAWHILAWRLIHGAFAATPAVFLYRDPLEVLVSQRRMRGVQAVPQPHLAALCGIADYGALGLDEYCARLLAASCDAALAAVRQGAMIAFNYRSLPAAVTTDILPRFGLAADAAALERMNASAAFDAKYPDQRFAADNGDKLAEAGEALRALSERIVGESYRALETLARR